MATPELTLSLAGRAYARLRYEILTCDLAPGQVVSERELARRYEMSKTPIREALSQVCHDGLMQRLPGRGYMVAPITIQDIRDLCEADTSNITAAITGRAIYEGTLDFASGQRLADELTG